MLLPITRLEVCYDTEFFSLLSKQICQKRQPSFFQRNWWYGPRSCRIYAVLSLSWFQMFTWGAHHCNRLCSLGCFSASRQWGRIVHSTPLLPHKSFAPQQWSLPARRPAHPCTWHFQGSSCCKPFPFPLFPFLCPDSQTFQENPLHFP